ncbi:MAG: hypothetical protein Q4F84_11080 [Fibrobacter sp.]|nr:hypothetical protein [Fibrobacter sp.]
MEINRSDLFYTCSLIEFIGREKKQTRSNTVSYLGKAMITHIYTKADVLHCEPIAKTADVFIELCHIPDGDFDNVSLCKYDVPDYWTIGEVYARLIEDVAENDIIDTLIAVYSSKFSDAISNYNSDFFYQSRDYIKECYKADKIL